VLVASGYAEPEEEAHAIIELLDRACDGLILYLENPLRDDVQRMIVKSQTPVVTVGGDECPPARARVTLDNFAGARDGMRLLLAEGHRRIVYLSGGMMYRDTRERLRGVAAALGEFGLGLGDITVEHGSFDERFGSEATTRLITTHPGFTAIFAGDDDVAAGALLALKRAGRRVPEDVSLIGFDDNFHARHLTPGLTTVRQPVDEAGRIATRLLLSILDGAAPTADIITVPTELIRRASVGSVHAEAAALLQFSE
jgi:LacI family transcriptional regulator